MNYHLPELSFSLTLTVRGVSNKHCLLTFFNLSFANIAYQPFYLNIFFSQPHTAHQSFCLFFFCSNSVHFVARYLTLFAFCLFSKSGMTSNGYHRGYVSFAHFLLYFNLILRSCLCVRLVHQDLIVLYFLFMMCNHSYMDINIFILRSSYSLFLIVLL